MRSKLAPHFGSAPFFTLVDLDSGQVAVLPNPACHSHSGACHHADMLLAERVDAVVSSGIGRNALQGLRQAGIEVLTQAGPEVADAVAAVRLGNAVPMAAAGACAGHEGQGCGHGPGHHHGDTSSTN